MFDLLAGNSSGVIAPKFTSVLEKSHHDPVYDIYWTISKTNSEFVSTSTDGWILWWDTRYLSNPIEEFSIEADVDGNGPKILGGTRLDYNAEAGAFKYLVGTEQGHVFQVNKKTAKVEII